MDVDNIRQRFEILKPTFNEQTERLFAAAEAKILGRGGISIVSLATGIERHRIARGIKELECKEKLDYNRIRRSGAGRKKIIDTDKNLEKDLNKLIEPYTRGDPEQLLRWTTKSLRNLEEKLKKLGHNVSHTS